MSDDPIVEEVRRVRRAYAKKFNYDLAAIFQDIRKRERRSGSKLVNLSRKRRAKKKPSSGVA